MGWHKLEDEQDPRVGGGFCSALAEAGLSERRSHFGVTDATMGLKTAAIVRHGLTSLICIGKTLAAGEAGRAAEVLGRPVLCFIHGSVTPGD